MAALTIKQKTTNYETFLHIQRVRELINTAVKNLLKRGEEHDQSKLDSPEVEAFTEYTPKLAELTFDSEEYKQTLEDMKPALDHHYAKNSHHPEHYKNGVNDMNLLDLVEMFVDWKASSERQHDGNIRMSIEKNAKRFGINKQLMQILENTIEAFE